jgi:hypothetical protein
VHVAAVVNLTDGTATFEHVTPLPGSPPATSRPVPDGTRLALRTRIASGATREYPIEFKPDLCRLPEEDETGLIDAIVDVDADVTAIELLIDGSSAATFDVGPPPVAAPRLGLLRTEAEGADEEEGLTVSNSVLSWEDGADGGRVTYIVQASTDGGQTWQTLAVGLTERTLALDPTDFAEAEHVRFRVLTSNGISYTEASTEDLSVDEL